MASLHMSEGSVSVGGVFGRVAIVGAGPGDPELLTLRAARYLQWADCVLYDPLINPEILALLRPRATRVPAGEYSMSQREMDALIVARARRGAFVVWLTGGNPYLFGRDAEDWRALKAAGVAVEVVPGIISGAGIAMTEGASEKAPLSSNPESGEISPPWKPSCVHAP